MELTFATYNIHKAIGADGLRDPERILRVLREVDADVIALQEVDRRFGPRASVLPRALLDDTPWLAIPVARRTQSLGWHGNALLVRRSFRCLAAGALDLPTLEPRGAVFAELSVDGGPRFTVVGTHLDLSGLRRRDQIRALVDWHAEQSQRFPTVLMGDFNQWGRLTGAMREFGMGWQQLAPGASYPARKPIARLDRIVTTPHWSFVDGGVHHSALAAQASDHLPVYAQLSLPKKWQLYT
ncbi:endonuclease/exonuclease/phosphatase family protein [Altererythrobacter sp. GH1-8]|uniref:endonuclease/exonuclease/phosphatase family protein n=1 Tax=Altererythrobacter sp. GH1-8 TaxID=3349333 RepID=UPI00374CA010